MISSDFNVQERQITAYWLGRNLSEGGVSRKLLAKVDLPTLANGECAAVIAHTGRSPVGGHWIPFVKERGSWWRLDSEAAYIEDPFIEQMNINDISGYTIDIFIIMN